MVYKVRIFCEEFSKYEGRFYKDGDYIWTIAEYSSFNEAYQKLIDFIEKERTAFDKAVVDDTFNGQVLLVLTKNSFKKIVHMSIREE